MNKAYNRSSQGLQARLIRYSFGDQINVRSFTNYCPFFWISVVALLCAPLAFVWKTLRLLAIGSTALLAFLATGIAIVLTAIFTPIWVYLVQPIVTRFPKLVAVLKWPFRIFAKQVIMPACVKTDAVIERKRYWNNDRFLKADFKTRVAIARMSSDLVESGRRKGNACSYGILSEELEERFPLVMQKYIDDLKNSNWAKEEFERQSRYYEPNALPDHFNPLLDAYYAYRFDGRMGSLLAKWRDVMLTQDLENQATEVFYEQKRLFYKHLAVACAPFIAILLHLFVKFVGTSVAITVLGTAILVIGGIIFLTWSIPYGIAIYKQICPPLTWED